MPDEMRLQRLLSRLASVLQTARFYASSRRSDWLDSASPVVAVYVPRYCVALDFVGKPGLSYAQNKARY